ncbi:unnamed protein product, partial [Brenthis ino]
MNSKNTNGPISAAAANLTETNHLRGRYYSALIVRWDDNSTQQEVKKYIARKLEGFWLDAFEGKRKGLPRASTLAILVDMRGYWR